MSSYLPQASEQHFRRQWYRLVIPWLFACGAFGLFAVRVPDGIWYAVPSLAICLLICVLLHGGVRLTRAGIEWYVLRPKWRFRRIQWEAVREVGVNHFFQPGVVLSVEPRRYEPWVSGEPRADRAIQIRIWTNGFVHGEKLGEAIQQRIAEHLHPGRCDGVECL